jgi:hypothetical protein
MRRKWTYGLLLAVILVFGLTLSGCDFFQSLGDMFYPDKDAEAQTGTGRLVETVVISPGSFSLTQTGSEDPTILIESGDTTTTQYTLTSRGNLRFLFPDGSPSSPNPIVLEAGDRVIERPEFNTLTIVRDQL